MMKKVSTILVLGVLSLGVCLWLVQPVVASPGPTPSKFAGSYYATGEFFDGVDFIPFNSLTQVCDDGTTSTSDTDDFFLGGTGFDSPARGSWEKTGPHSAKAVILYFAYDPEGNFILTGRNEYTVTAIDGSDDLWEGEGVLKVYFPGMDPLDPDAGIVAGVHTFTTRRISP